MRDDDLYRQVEAARQMNTQALLLALYDRTEDVRRISEDFAIGEHSHINVFDERRRLSVVIRYFGEMMLAATDSCFANGDRSNGWHDLSLKEMRDLVMVELREGLSRAEAARAMTTNLENMNEGRGV